ncbi:MAG: hypothetical protein ACRCZ2_13830 [Fusobacteriaceae bacterium]
MAIKWTKEMLDELVVSMDVKGFANKYKMSRLTANNKREILLANTTKKEEKVDVERPVVGNLDEQLSEVNASTISIIPSVILNIDSLIEKGVQFYLVDVNKNIGVVDKSISDIVHVIENQYDTMREEDMIPMAKNLGLLRRKRRLFKNEYDFLDNHRTECTSFIKFIKDVRQHSQRVCNKLYTMRVLKEELGGMIVCNENNSELIHLREENAELKAQASQSVVYDNKTENRMLELEKMAIKQNRNLLRKNGGVPVIDKLELNWKDMFLKNMDEQTRVGLLKDCNDAYNGADFKTVKEWVVMNDILPRKLVELGYFTKKNR